MRCDDESTLERTYRAGANDFLTKPFLEADQLSAIKAAVVGVVPGVFRSDGVGTDHGAQ